MLSGSSQPNRMLSCGKSAAYRTKSVGPEKQVRDPDHTRHPDGDMKGHFIHVSPGFDFAPQTVLVVLETLDSTPEFTNSKLCLSKGRVVHAAPQFLATVSQQTLRPTARPINAPQ
jgi:hypothetical protein